MQISFSKLSLIMLLKMRVAAKRDVAAKAYWIESGVVMSATLDSLRCKGEIAALAMAAKAKPNGYEKLLACWSEYLSTLRELSEVKDCLASTLSHAGEVHPGDEGLDAEAVATRERSRRRQAASKSQPAIDAALQRLDALSAEAEGKHNLARYRMDRQRIEAGCRASWLMNAAWPAAEYVKHLSRYAKIDGPLKPSEMAPPNWQDVVDRAMPLLDFGRHNIASFGTDAERGGWK